MSGHELAIALRAAYLTMHRRTDSILLRSGVTADQFVVLAELSEGVALTQRDLVSRTWSDPNTLRAMLVLLERRRLVERRPHPTDGRARSVSLTKNGWRVFRKLWRTSEPVREALVTAVGPDEAEILVAQLRKIVAALDTQRVESSRTRRHPPVGVES